MTGRLFAVALSAAFSLCSLSAQAVEPIYGPATHDRTAAALARYQEIAARGGWAALPGSVKQLVVGATGPDMVLLHQRLAVGGDLDPALAASDWFGEATTAAIQKFQARHGLSLTGTVGTLTLRALNVPVEARLRALTASLERLKNNGFAFGQRYVVVNIPGATAEAVENGQVARSHVAVVGRPDRASPVVESRITAINLNPTWTAPISITKADIIPKARTDPQFLAKNNMRLIGAGGVEIDPATIDWNQAATSVPFSVRQDSGPTNSLGRMRIDMPNSHAVYMHDTPKKGLFRSDVRFHSSGCARIQNIGDLAEWLLQGTGVDRIAIEMGMESGETKTIRLTRPVPVAWVYLTAWGDGDGGVQFRDDIYKLDGSSAEIAASTLVARPAKPPVNVDTMTTGSIPPRRPAKQPIPVVANALSADER